MRRLLPVSITLAALVLTVAFPAAASTTTSYFYRATNSARANDGLAPYVGAGDLASVAQRHAGS